MTINNSEARYIFREALGMAEKWDIDMSVTDWAQSVGVMSNYGHGEEWDLPKDEDGQIDMMSIIKLIEDFARGYGGAI